jgi:hypothetical protein
MAIILTAAENFAFGPAGKLLTVAPHLKAKGHRLIFAGYGTAYDLASRESVFDSIHEIDTESRTSDEAVTRLFDSADLLISCMDWGAATAARRAGIPVVWMDSLFYWWESLPTEILGAELYVKQDILPDRQNMSKYAPGIKNLLSVGPIVEPFVPEQDMRVDNQALVCLGGIEAPGWYQVGKDHNYPFTITKLLAGQVHFERFDSVLFTGYSRIISQLREIYHNEKFRFETLAHEDFTKELQRSRVALMVGGLESSLEAFQCGVPVIFLPPLNVTQHLQVGAFRAAGAGLTSIHLSDYFDDFRWSGKSRRSKVSDFLERLAVFESSPEILLDVAARIDAWLKDEVLQARQREAQLAYMATLKPRGLDEVVSAIDKLATRCGMKSRHPADTVATHGEEHGGDSRQKARDG